MKRNLFALFLGLGLIVSCSSDKDSDTPTDENSIVGTWDATQLVINNDTASDDAKNGRDILDFLTAKDCYIVTFTFNEDLSVVSEDAINYLEINVNQDGTGLDIPCPTQSDSYTSTYTFNGTTLSFVDGEGQTVTLDVSLSGNTMTVEAQDLDIPNFNDSGQLVFKKR